MRVSKFAFVLVAVGAVALVGAQGGIRPGVRQGGMAQGRPGGPGGNRVQFGGRMTSDTNPGFLQIPAVQKELHLSAGQIQKITAAVPQRGAPIQPGGDIQKMMADRMKAMNATLALLNPAQKQRLKEITLQSYGGNAMQLPSVQKELGLSASQIKQISAATDKVAKERQAAMQNMGVMRPDQPQDPKAWQARIDKMRAENEKGRKEIAAAVDKTLTGAQKTKWKAMQGKPFDLASLRMRRVGPGGPGGPGGGRGGRGNAAGRGRSGV